MEVDDPEYPTATTVRAEGSGGASQRQEPAGEPHGALFLVLRYLRLQELLSFQRVCRSLRDAVADDASLWRDVVVEPPLSGKLTDGILVDQVASRAGGRLRTLVLVNCWKLTDASLHRIVHDNPRIVKLHVPGCSYISADAVVRAVRTLVDRRREAGAARVELQVRLYGVSHITEEHLDDLKSMLPGVRPPATLYGGCCSLQTSNDGCRDDDRPIDVDICPRCVSPRLVFDCTRQACRVMKGRTGECRGCIFCIPRCGDCGGCVGLQELGEESACSHLLCLECWLRLPKCDLCNRPYCTKHHRRSATLPNLTGGQWCPSELATPAAAGFICEECQRHEDLLFDDPQDQ